MKFRDPTEAGERLAEVLALYRHPSPIVLAMSRRAIPVAAVVADALAAPHDLLLARAIGPAEALHPLGGVADPGVHVLKRPLVRMLGLSEGETERMVTRELLRLAADRRELCRDRSLPNLAGKCVILIDDALASDGAARAAVRGARTLGAARVIVAAPVGVEEVIESLCADADEVVCVYAPEEWEPASSHHANL